MDKFLTYIERFKFAILGTVLFHFVVFMSSNFVTVERAYNSKFAEENEVEVALEEDEIEIDEELLEMLNRQNELNNAPIYNLTADANDERKKSFDNFSTQDMDEQVEQEARDLEKQFFDEWASRHDKGEGGAKKSSNIESNSDSEADRENNNSNRSSVDNTGENAFAGRVMVSFNLKNRKAHALEIPGYTCNGSGTVVVDIKVDRTGNVKSVSYNPGRSSGATACMIEKAERYAKRARFNYDNKASLLADGSITYVFQGQ